MITLTCRKLWFVLLVIVLVCSACSGHKSPVTPVVDDYETLIKNEVIDPGNRHILAMYDAVIDIENETFEVTPVNYVYFTATTY